ncbi:TPA: hypothetical protein UM046_004323 [Stenotrophomonas maltophilia]|nr:hypothetical protein [Stenotrophomonas maltophilia]HEL3786506.1 hypothetical protein [Stenotrophomonas maltophilia]
MDLRKRINWVTVFVYVALIAIGFAAALGMLGLTGQIVFGKDTPAWVQAIGSIIAILIAVAVPAAQHFLAGKKQQQETLDRARSLGLMLLPHIQKFADSNSAIWVKEIPENADYELGKDGCFVGPLTEQALEIPPVITSVISRLHELGPAAEGLQIAVYNVMRARELLSIYTFTERNELFGETVTSRRVTYEKGKFYHRLGTALHGLHRSQANIEAFFPQSHPGPGSWD